MDVSRHSITDAHGRKVRRSPWGRLQGTHFTALTHQGACRAWFCQGQDLRPSSFLEASQGRWEVNQEISSRKEPRSKRDRLGLCWAGVRQEGPGSCYEDRQIRPQSQKM